MLSKEDLKEILPNPIDTIAKLDEYIIGQEDAKKSLSVMLLNRGLLKLGRAGKLDVSVPLQKSNVLLIGPSGCGKTALIKALGEIADIPITTYDITSITSGAYIGNKVEDILVEHVNTCYEYARANFLRMAEHTKEVFDETTSFSQLVSECVETGIVYIDEIDKTRAIDDNNNQGDSVQNELLKIIEEGEVSLQPARGKVNGNLNFRSVNTKDILFVGGGAFYGLHSIIKKRMSKTAGIGFGADVTKNKELLEAEYLKHVTTRDLLDYGFKNEFLGRLPLRSVLSPLTREALVEVMKYSRSSVLIQYKELFRVFGIELKLEKAAYLAIADQALELETGARSLKTILNNILMDEFCTIFSNTEETFTVTKDLVNLRGRGGNV